MLPRSAACIVSLLGKSKDMVSDGDRGGRTYF